jgi:F0F1-type ATP synthase membrane subunit b/b'
VNDLLDQFSLDQTFFIELGLIAGLFFVLSHLYFRPFLQLFQARHRKTVEDREAAQRLMAQADVKWAEYQRFLMEERVRAKAAYDKGLIEAKQQEASFLAEATREAKAITQETMDALAQQRQEVEKHLDAHVDALAQSIIQKLLPEDGR